MGCRALVALSAVALASGCTIWREYTHEQLQGELSQHFPVRDDQAGGVLRLVLSNPEVTFAGDRLQLALSIEATAAIWVTHGKGVVQGTLEYHPESGAIFLRAPTVQSLVFDTAPPELGEALRIAAETALIRVVGEKPIYTLDARHGGDEALARQHLRRVFIKEDRMVLELHS